MSIEQKKLLDDSLAEIWLDDSAINNDDRVSFL